MGPCRLLTMQPQVTTRSTTAWAESPRGLVRALVSALSPGVDTRDLPWFLRWMRAMAVQDWLLVGYFTALMVMVYRGTGPRRDFCVERVGADLAVVLLGLAVVRGEIARWGGFVGSLFYRSLLICSVLGSYFQLKDVLPEVTQRSVDAEILTFDLRVFGYEPALAWDRYVNPHTTEWFAFFYFGYFVLISLYVFGSMLFARDRQRLAEFSLGIVGVFCIGHLTYTLVPGFGPYHHLAGTFAHALQGPTFWPLVWAAVHSAGAQKDIFPSLHTAVPTFMSLFAVRHRRVFPFRYVWLPTVLFTSQIILATMFLRWHYLVDIVAGLTLATVCSVLSARLTDWERRRRELMGVPPTWVPLIDLSRFVR